MHIDNGNKLGFEYAYHPCVCRKLGNKVYSIFLALVLLAHVFVGALVFLNYFRI